jgi:hypothetical protein
MIIEILLPFIAVAPDFGAHICRDFIQGMGRINEKFVVLLVLDYVLSQELNTVPIGSEAAI